MRIIRSTDGRHLGKVIGTVNTGDTVDLDGFRFTVTSKKSLADGTVLLSNFNYQLQCEVSE